ncbi:MAG: hypothetical protein AB8E82_17600 [Aureispira sp.]
MNSPNSWPIVLCFVLQSFVSQAQFCGGDIFSILMPSINYPPSSIAIASENVFIVVDNKDTAAWAIRLQVSTDTNAYVFTPSSGFVCKENDWNYTNETILHNRSDVFRTGKPQHIIPLRLTESGTYFFTCRAGRSARNSAYTTPISIHVRIPSFAIDQLLGSGDYLIQQLNPQQLFDFADKQINNPAPPNASTEEKWAFYQENIPEESLKSWFSFYTSWYYWERNYLEYGLRSIYQLTTTNTTESEVLNRAQQQLTQCLFRLGNLNRYPKQPYTTPYTNILSLIEEASYDTARVALEAYFDKSQGQKQLNALYWLSYVAQQQNDLAQEEAWLLKGFQWAQKMGNNNDVGSFAYHLGTFYKKNYDTFLAIEYLDTARLRFLPEGNVYAMSQVYYQLGTLFSDQGNINFSIDYLDNARMLAAFQGDLPLQIRIYQQLVQHFFELQDCKKAEDYTTIVQVLEDSLQQVRNREIEFIARMQFTQQAMLAAQQAEETANRQLSNTWTLLLGLVALVALSTSIGIYLYRQKQVLKEKEQSLQTAYQRETKLNHLLEEVYDESIHRIKNYFAVIGAAINKELRKHRKAGHKLSDTQQDFLTHLQQKLFIFKNINEALSSLSTQHLDNLSIDVVPILTSLQRDFQRNYPAIHFESDFIPTFETNYRTAEIICLIVHEAIMNATKHAFEEHNTHATIQLTFTSEGIQTNFMQLLIQDNGNGMLENNHKNSGIKRIETFVKTLNGKLSIRSNTKEGTAIYINFPMNVG